MDIIWKNTIEGKPKPQLRANRFCSNSNFFLTPLSIKIRLCNCANLYQTNAPINSKHQHPPPGKPRAFELLKIELFKFPPPWAKIAFKYPTLALDLTVN